MEHFTKEQRTMKQDNFLFKNENSFCNYIKKYLLDYFGMVQRIESGSTARGIPDLYIVDIDQWVELKCQNDLSLQDDKWTIDWRAGQQAWAAQYYMAKEKLYKVYGNRVNSNRYTVTLVAMKDCIALIKMKMVFDNNTIRKDIAKESFLISFFNKEGCEIVPDKYAPEGYKLVNYNGCYLIDNFLQWRLL